MTLIAASSKSVINISCESGLILFIVFKSLVYFFCVLFSNKVYNNGKTAGFHYLDVDSVQLDEISRGGTKGTIKHDYLDLDSKPKFLLVEKIFILGPSS